ncbi:hypothetical protein COR50_19335 [Chitinophaga caeni]|uniref:Probable sensor domain-containing protein n=1 Tax=Chitinophaga caeni TaxID=2029983 RepID=A0A291QZ81_9BACT|nr:hypothetical protein [Chitinophaga caeni]ATL49153.1 hypothetical protein COR50_19335 [Chitinophaga caeni]
MEKKFTATYQAAANVADKIAFHFSKHIAVAKAEEETDIAEAPSTEMVQKMIDIAFWTSLRREEGVAPRISLAFLSPEQVSKPLQFAHKLAFSPDVLTKLAPGVEGAGIHVGIWYDEDGLYIWGTTIRLPNYCFVLDVPEPGLLVVKHRRILGLAKFTNVAVLKGDQVKVVDESCSTFTETPGIIKALLGLETSAVWNNPVNILIQIAVSMRAHGRGGILLVVPAREEKWRSSIIHPMQYGISPSFSGVADLARLDDSNASEIFWQNALRREVGNITGLTAVDGATIINTEHELLGFGAKIARAKGATQVESVMMIEPIIGGRPKYVSPSNIGGTRHLSAAQFIHDQRDAIALVASQDGYFTIFSWAAEQEIVQAHRVDILLL